MKLMLAAASIAAIIATAAPASAQGVSTGMGFYESCRTTQPNKILPFVCKTYIAGFAGGLSYGHAICIPNRVSPDQLQLVVRDWMRSHPARLNEAPERMIQAALVDAWPCP
jgi:hypothetical protein